ncbi:MAG: hypothetical protein PHV02_19470 [Rhodocyclaceae bacterium]|nr:hypothetical protein [Rhodocyclaceae bacterium]
MIALELPAEIDEHNQIHLQLPEKVAPQTAKVIVLYEDKPLSKKPMQLGLFAGKIHMSDDFDAPLPDSFWLEGKL